MDPKAYFAQFQQAALSEAAKAQEQPGAQATGALSSSSGPMSSWRRASSNSRPLKEYLELLSCYGAHEKMILYYVHGWFQ